MARFKRLTDAEARSMTRRELSGRIEAEQAYWHRKRLVTDEDAAAEREFRRIFMTYLGPDQIAAAMRNLTDHIQGTGPGGWWESRPCDDDLDPGQLAARQYVQILARERAGRAVQEDM
jgi:hypothetical protein